MQPVATPLENVPRDWDEVKCILEALPREIPILPVKERNNFSKYQNPPWNTYDKGQAWKACAEAMDEHDSELCRGYREEIDTLLVFAGLFSAVVTAFTIESYQWLKDDQSDAIVDLLSQIAQSVARNGSAVHLPPSSGGLPFPVSVRVNVYWFSALSLSLAAALVGILGKQWLRAFERREVAAPKEAVGLRQTKYEGFQKWNVGSIISALPLLLQVSLALFAIGVIELLWQLHFAVAMAVCVPTAVAGTFYGVTTLVPVIQYGRCWWNVHRCRNVSLCAYRSPQALLALRVFQASLSWSLRLASATIEFGRRHFEQRFGPMRRTTPAIRVSTEISSWGDWDKSFTEFKKMSCSDFSIPHSSFAGLQWLKRNNQQGELMESIYHCLWEAASARHGDWARGDIGHVVDATQRRSDHWKKITPGALALSFLTKSGISLEFAGEVLIQNIMQWDVYSVTSLLRHFEYRFLSGSADIMKGIIMFCRLHISEDIGPLLSSVTLILVYPKDECEFAMRSCIVYTWLDWLASFHADSRDARWKRVPWPLLEALFEMCLSSQGNEADSVQTGLLDTLPHVEVLAAHIRAIYEYGGVQCQWPLAVNWQHRIQFSDLSSHRRTEGIICHLLRISVRGLVPHSSNATTDEYSQTCSGDSSVGDPDIASDTDATTSARRRNTVELPAVASGRSSMNNDQGMRNSGAAEQGLRARSYARLPPTIIAHQPPMQPLQPPPWLPLPRPRRPPPTALAAFWTWLAL